MAKPANEWVNNYQSGVQNSQTKYEQGVRNPQASWSQGLVQSKSRMVSNFTQAMQGNRFDNAVNAVGDAGWAQKTIDKSANYAASATRAAQNYQAKVQEMHAIVETVQARVRSMPKDTHQQRMARMVANATGIMEETARRRGF